MYIKLHELLERCLQDQALPGIIAFNRIDGPGSSLDLREFQQALWHMPRIPKDILSDPAME